MNRDLYGELAAEATVQIVKWCGRICPDLVSTNLLTNQSVGLLKTIFFFQIKVSFVLYSTLTYTGTGALLN